MRKVTFLKLLICAVAFCGAGLEAGDYPALQKVKLEADALERGTLALTQKDVDVTIGGRVYQDWVGYDKIYTLQASNDDQLSGFRTRANFDIAATHGRQTFGKSAADAFLRFACYGFWRREHYYTPFRDNSTYTKSDVGPLNLLTYVEEAWINLHFGTFFKAYENWFSHEDHPVSLKVGYFPYELGRGIVLGTFPMHAPYNGWESYGLKETRYNHPGILIHGNINKEITYDLYYSKQQENSFRREFTWEQTNSNRTDGNSDLTGPRRSWRGVGKDVDLWAARMDFKHMKRWGDLHVQPYGMYIDASEMKIETVGDSNARIGTVGMMVEYKKGRLSVNAEVAGQFGHQNVFAIDRNQEETYHAADGTQMYRHSHVFYGGNGYTENKAPINGTATTANANLVINKGGWDANNNMWVPSVTKNGDQLFALAGVPASNLETHVPGTSPASGVSTSDVYNSQVTGNARFRDGYRINYRGFMGVVDVMYEFEETPVSICAACAYVSGDKYPYNTERDKRYKAFLPYGDYYYTGKYVKSQMILEARKLPRPMDISLRHQYAFNNVEDMSNLAYIGFGTKWRPFKKKDKLLLQTNVLWFCQTHDFDKWDKEGRLPEAYYDSPNWYHSFYGDDSWNDVEGRWTDENGHTVGWKERCTKSSRMLGTELNFEAQYKPVTNCLLQAQLGCFIPGNRYKDSENQPNVRTYNGPQASVGNFGLGDDTVWRAKFSMNFDF